MPAPDARDVARLATPDALRALAGGVVALLLVAGLAIGLPKAVGEGSDDATASQPTDPGAALELPEEMGSWIAIPTLLAQEGEDEAAEQYASDWEYVDSQLVALADAPADSERYFQPGSEAQLAVQAYRGPDGPLVPATLIDPASGDAPVVRSTHGEVECVLGVVSGEASPTPQVQEILCRRTSADLTIRVTVLENASDDDVATFVDNLWDRLDGAGTSAEDR
ncbi:hypothetical protein RDV89_17235 [Nocardioides zeae]|uniref:DUF5642 domain-containing protein n=1 Tax=Nocardioides imazamoxiresistens TaxID=3231893 RepID=A0ABU3Q033_9ACTN|nr:hypothetical protein [Nocardioides zeae]MDT9594835.1 hypothetical protein [Nocardioides zeae]